MRPSGTTARRSVVVVLALLALWGGVHGCVSPTVPIGPPGGGQHLALSFATFTSTVSPILERQGCDAGGDCHGGGIRGTLQLSPRGAKDLAFDFDQVSMQVYPTSRDLSPILTRPLALAAGGTPHPFKPFASAADSDYIAIRAWIQAGVLQ
jgi:hypothetical protein